ncbi:MAG: hypothetical protein CMF59_09015 [Leptospiraceae bacterium]|nr:hypothetical protein [Leptospiraceae bacterium]
MQRSRIARLRYSFDNFMSKGGMAVFLALLTMFALSFVVLSGLRILFGLLMPDESASHVFSQMWRVFLQILDGGAIAEDTDANWLSRVSGIITVFVGLILFSSLVAFITSQFEAKLAELRKGRSAVLEQNHAVILGFEDRVLDILDELIIANESEPYAAVAILAEKDKEEMDDFLNDRLTERKSTRVVTRSGSTSSIGSLRKMGIEHCNSVLILNDAGSADSPADRDDADARVLKSIIAVIAATDKKSHPPIVAEIHSQRLRQVAANLSEGSIIAVDREALLARMLVQTSRVPGLFSVYSAMVGFDGQEIYFYRPDSGWQNESFADILFRFSGSGVMGFRHEDGEILLNPPADFRPAANDQAIILAEDDSTIEYLSEKLDRPPVEELPDFQVEQKSESYLIIGWNQKGPVILREYADYIPAGSRMSIVTRPEEGQRDTIAEAIESIRSNSPQLHMDWQETDWSEPDALLRLAPESYGNVILLARDGTNPEAVDAASIAGLLQVRQHLKTMERKLGHPPATRVISEIMDSENVDLVLETGVKDFLISNQFISRILAQVAMEPDVHYVYDDLFSPDGSEIYLKPISAYFRDPLKPHSFGECVSAALARNEVCIGIRIARFEGDPERNHGVLLIPEMHEVFEFGGKDNLIVLAEDDG